ncbi:MAG: aminomethyl-transferring glycine dehydrogenase subunit GcvPB [Candidatus Omnitrophota bacterium]
MKKEQVDLIFDKSVAGRAGFEVPADDTGCDPDLDPRYCRAEDALLPEVSELDVVRHFTRLSQRNYSVDANFYPLGSCTMKYNPRFTEQIAALPGLADLHPLLPQLGECHEFVQGALQILYEAEALLCEITGFSAFTMQPLAGAHGELTGAMMMAAYHRARGNNKKYILIPDSAHGTNPASAAIAGYETISVASNTNGILDIEDLKEHLNSEVAGVMLTCPNTLGLFHPDIARIADMVHEVDGLMYYDGANLNAVLGRCRPGDLGFDLMHVNLHKTFSTPHGGGGPGAGPVGVAENLIPYLPVSRVVKDDTGRYVLNYDYPDSIGYVASFYGNFGVIVKALAYMLFLGDDGLKDVSAHAVLNANYILRQLRSRYDLPFDRRCMHECVFSAVRQAKNGIHAIDIAKYLIDRGVHPMTVYFPLIVREAMMIEPTETESKESIDRFISIMTAAADLAEKDPDAFKDLPKTTPVSRPDEVRAARELDVNYFAQ